jgi:hypothetical protein
MSRAFGDSASTRHRWVLPAVIVLAFLPAVSATVVPSHDALQVFTAFWTYVSGLVTDGHLPQWMPYGRYGTPSTPILMYVTPMAWLTGAVGAAMHVAFGFSDTLALFKLTVALEYLLFAAGLLRIGRLLFESTWVQYGVAALGVFSSPWILSLDGNFHAFYMTPWILASLAQALQTGLPAHLGAAALLAVFACVGNVPYFPPFLLLQLTVFTIPLVVAYPRQARQLLLRGDTWLWMAGAGVLCAIHFVALVKGMEGLAILSLGRDPITNQVPKDVFLTYGGVSQLGRLLTEFLTGRVTNGDNTFYMGLGTLILLPMSLMISRPPIVRAIQWLALFVLLFSTGGIVASVGYYFPGMAYYRHISIVFGPFRVLAFLCAGYVIDRMIREPAVWSGWRHRVPRAWRGVAAAGVVALVAAEFLRASVSGSGIGLVLFPRIVVGEEGWGAPVAIRLACYGVLALALMAKLRRGRLLPKLVLLGLLLDIGMFWGQGWADWPRLTPGQAGFMRRITATRSLADPGPRLAVGDLATRGSALRFVRATPPLNIGTTYVHTYLWTGVDPCVPQLHTDFVAESIAGLFGRRGVRLNAGLPSETKVLADPWLARALACRRPRVLSDASLVEMDRGYDWMVLTLDNSQGAVTPVVVSEAFHKAWRLSIDGSPAPLTPRNEAFLGADVAPGRHLVEFRFHQPLVSSLRLAEALLSGLAAGWMLVYVGRRLT